MTPDRDIDEVFSRQASYDAIGNDRNALKSVAWDKIEHRVTETGGREVIGHDLKGGHSAVIDRTEPETADQVAQIYQKVEDGISYDVQRRADGSEWLLGRTGEGRTGVTVQLVSPTPEGEPGKGADAKSQNTEGSPMSDIVTPSELEGAPGKEGEGTSTMEEAARVLYTGLEDVASEFLKTTRLNEVADWLESKVPLGSVDFKPKTETGQDVAPMVGQGVALLPAVKLMKALGVVSNFVRWTAGGALVDATMRDPEDENLGDLAASLGKLDNVTLETLRSGVADALSKNETDSEFIKRLKNVGEGVVTGATFDGLLKLYRTARQMKSLSPKMLAALGITSGAGAMAPSDAEGGMAGRILDKLGGPGRAAKGLKPTPKALPLPPAVEQDIARTYSPYRVDSPLVEGVDFNMGNLNTSDQVKELIDTTSRAYADKIGDKTMGKVSHEITRQIADLVGVDVEQAASVVSKLPGQTQDLHVKALVMRDALVASAEEVDRRAWKIANTPAQVTDDELLAFREQIARHAALQANFKGVQTDIARALSAFRIPADSNSMARSQAVMEALNAAGGKGTISELAALWLKTPVDKRGRLAADGLGAKSVDALREIWINGLLSSPRTHEVNAASNFLFTAWMMPERALAGLSGSAHRLAGSREEHAYVGEAGAMMHGWLESIPDAVQLGWQTFRQGAPPDALGKIEAASRRAISSERWGLDETSMLGRFVDIAGVGVRLPGRFLMSADEFNKAIGRQMERRAQAYRMSHEALRNGKTEAEAAQLYADVMAGQVEAAERAADQFASTITFTRELGTAGQAVQNAARRVPGAWLVVPFIRTPINILKETLQRTPAAPIVSREIQRDLLAGGVRRDLALAKVSMGTAAMAWAVDLASRGVITGGGPSDPKLKAAWLEKYQPYSVKIGDEWVPYGRLEPVATLFGIAADFTDFRKWAPRDLAEESEATLSTRAVGSILEYVGNKTFFMGLSDIAAAWKDPDRYAEPLLARMISSAAPYSSLSRDVESATDPARRDTKRDPYEKNPLVAEFYRVLNETKAKTPGWSSDLPPVTNFWGEDRKAYEGDWINAFNAFAPKKDKAQAIDEELIRLRYPISMPDREAFGVKLDPQRYHNLVKAMNTFAVAHPTEPGKIATMREYMNWAVGSVPYKTLISDQAKIDVIKDIRGKFLDAAKQMMVTPGNKYFDPELAAWALRAAAQKPLGIPFRP